MDVSDLTFSQNKDLYLALHGTHSMVVSGNLTDGKRLLYIVITSKEEFLKSDCLLCSIVDYVDINKAVNIWENSCTESRAFIFTKETFEINDIKNL